MNTLLKAIQSEIKDNLSYLKGAVYITPEGPEIIVLPKVARLPCVTVKDGSETVKNEPGKGRKIIRQVRVSALVEIYKAEKSIVSDETTKGVIDILKDADTNLANNLLNLANYSMVLFRSTEPSEIIELNNAIAVKKTAVYEYHEIT